MLHVYNPGRYSIFDASTSHISLLYLNISEAGGGSISCSDSSQLHCSRDQVACFWHLALRTKQSTEVFRRLLQMQWVIQRIHLSALVTLAYGQCGLYRLLLMQWFFACPPNTMILLIEILLWVSYEAVAVRPLATSRLLRVPCNLQHDSPFH